MRGTPGLLVSVFVLLPTLTDCAGKSNAVASGGRAGASAAAASGGRAGSGQGGDEPSSGTGGIGGARAGAGGGPGAGRAGSSAGSEATGGTSGGRAGSPAGGRVGEGGEQEAGSPGMNDAGAGGAPDVFTPTDLGSRLVLWLDAGLGVVSFSNSKVAVWTDLSSNRNPVLQDDDARRPLWTASGINGLPSIVFSGTNTFLKVIDNPPLRWGTGDFTILVVARGAPSLVTNAMLYQKSVLNTPFPGPALLLNPDKPMPSMKASMQIDANNYAVSASNVQDTAARLFGGGVRVTSDGTRIEVRIDGVVESAVVTTEVVNVDAEGAYAVIGHNGYSPGPGFQAFEGEISEICAVKGAITDAELAELEGYLLAKYGLR